MLVTKEVKILKKRIAFFVESYGNSARANGICTKTIIDEISKENHDVVVFSSKSALKQPYSKTNGNISVYKFNRDLGYIFHNYPLVLG